MKRLTLELIAWKYAMMGKSATRHCFSMAIMLRWILHPNGNANLLKIHPIVYIMTSKLEHLTNIINTIRSATKLNNLFSYRTICWHLGYICWIFVGKKRWVKYRRWYANTMNKRPLHMNIQQNGLWCMSVLRVGYMSILFSCSILLFLGAARSMEMISICVCACQLQCFVVFHKVFSLHAQHEIYLPGSGYFRYENLKVSNSYLDCYMNITALISCHDVFL